MSGREISGGPTRDEILAVSLSKLGPSPNDTVLEIGCGTGKVTCAIARVAEKVVSIDRRSGAIAAARETARDAGLENIIFSRAEATDFLASDNLYDCAFIGGTRNLETFLPVLAKRVKRVIVINAVLLSTVSTAVTLMKDLSIFDEAVQVQISRSLPLAASIMFRPIDPVFVIVGRGTAC